MPLWTFSLHFPPVQSSFAIQHIAFCPKCPPVLPLLCPPPQPLTSTPTQVTTAAGQELSATLHAQDTTWNSPVLGYNAAAHEIKSDDSICSTCCKCKQTDSLSQSRIAQESNLQLVHFARQTPSARLLCDGMKDGEKPSSHLLGASILAPPNPPSGLDPAWVTRGSLL